jgi:hypothetical protein
MSLNSTLIASAVLVVFTLLAIYLNRKLPKRSFKSYKLPLFLVMAGAVVFNTALLAYNTVHLNLKAESKGPVHWHTDIEFWACGSEIELRDPTGLLSNKIGTSTYHEHNDKRIHLEGVVVSEKRDASLGKFMSVTGGYLQEDSIGIPLNEDKSKWLATPEHQDGDKQSTAFQADMAKYVGDTDEGPVLQLYNSDYCGDQKGQVQAFVYHFDKASKTYTQEKLRDAARYVMRDESVVPPGDCVIVEFGEPKTTTDKICNQYGVRDAERCEQFGVKGYNPELCNIRKVETGAR